MASSLGFPEESLHTEHATKHFGASVALLNQQEYSEAIKSEEGGKMLQGIVAVQMIATVRDDAINVRECEVFSYIVDDEDPKAVTGDLWSINYFFFNSSMNRMAYLKCIANSKFRNISNQEHE